ncbi:MAG: hypothetical protein AAB263_19300, partial [Planctomycetota bacterium]
FLSTSIKPRASDITFLPVPAVAKALSMGQGSALAKVRWIDSFSYFSYQIDHQNDAVSGLDQRGGFERLYETFIALDPLFLPFYEHAVMTTGGILKHHQVALSFAMRGQLEMPYTPGLWRLAAAELAVNYQWNSKEHVNLMNGFLKSWMDVDPTTDGKQEVVNWQRGLLFKWVDDLKTLPYWIEQLKSTKPNTPPARFVERTIREILAVHCVNQLSRLLVDRASLLADPMALDLDKIAKVYPHFPDGIPGTAPIRVLDGRAVLREDPFGWPFRWNGTTVESPGYMHGQFLARHGVAIGNVEKQAGQHGRPAADLAEAEIWAKEKLPSPPDHGRWDFTQLRPEVIWPDPPAKPWQLR